MTNRCDHPDSPTARRACEHLLADLLAGRDVGVWRRFTGRRSEFVWLCETCAKGGIEEAPAAVCSACASQLEDGGVEGSRGLPEVRQRHSDLRFSHSELVPAGAIPDALVAVEPLNELGDPAWIALTGSGSFVRLSAESPTVIQLGTMEEAVVPDVSNRSWLTGNLTPEEAAQLGPPAVSALAEAERLTHIDLVEKKQQQYSAETAAAWERSADLNARFKNRSGALLRIDAGGGLAAVCTRKGYRRGIVYDIETGNSTMRLDHPSHHSDQTTFPVAFFSDDNRSLIVHATAWNRLDISDPRTGELLTTRAYEKGTLRPMHFLDYFHGALTVSPDSSWIAEDGWVWHPVGVVASWSSRRWLHENVWESEDGLSRKGLAWRDYFWESPLCWLDGRTLAVYGFGEDDDWIIPAVRLFDVESGDQLGWFPGPAGTLESDGTHLYSWDEGGTAVWDPRSAERLHLDPTLRPSSFHRTSGSFLSVAPDGSVRLSQIAV